MRRREFIKLVGTAAAWPVVARARTYPVRPVRIVVGFGAGGATDILARLMGQWLSERLGQPFIIENRTGRRQISPPRQSCARRRTATRSSWSLRRTRSTRRFTKG